MATRKESKQKCRKLLNDLFSFMRDETQDEEMRKHMWGILTALRGPDNENGNLKEATTQRIRGALYEFVGRERNAESVYDNVLGALVSPFQPLPSAHRYTHFDSHVHMADKALTSLGITRDGKVIPYAKE